MNKEKRKPFQLTQIEFFSQEYLLAPVKGA